MPSPNSSRKICAHDAKKFGKISSDILLLKSVLSYLEEKASHQINLRRLRTEAHHLMEICFWANSHHWSSYPSRRKKSEPNTVVRVAYFKNLNWFGFLFSKFHPCAVEVLRVIPAHERFFYEKTHDRYTKFRAWCIDAKHFERVLSQLQQMTDIELEFVVHPYSHGLVVPEPLKGMGLTFYERGGAARELLSRGAGEKGRSREGEMNKKKAIQSHRELDVYQIAFDAAMRIFEISKGFPIEER